MLVEWGNVNIARPRRGRIFVASINTKLYFRSRRDHMRIGTNIRNQKKWRLIPFVFKIINKKMNAKMLSQITFDPYGVGSLFYFRFLQTCDPSGVARLTNLFSPCLGFPLQGLTKPNLYI